MPQQAVFLSSKLRFVTGNASSNKTNTGILVRMPIKFNLLQEEYYTRLS